MPRRILFGTFSLHNYSSAFESAGLQSRDEVFLAEDEHDEKLEMDYAPRKIALPEGMEAQESFAIQKHHLDTHHHVNNCQYIRMGADYLPEGFEIRQMRAEYKKQALLGDVFYPAVKLEMGKVTVALSTENGEPYAIVEFMSA